MAGDSKDDFQKTEEPTDKKLADSRQKGQVANSREINHWFILLAGAIIVTALAPSVAGDLQRGVRVFVESPHAIPADFNHLHGMLVDVTTDVALALMVPLLLLMAGALAAGLVQNGVIFAPDQIKPKLEKISLFSGVKRLFSSRSIMEFTKGIAKLAVVGAAATALMLPEMNGLENLVATAPEDALSRFHGLAIRLIIGVLAVMSVIAALDFGFQKFKHARDMRMTRQEVKDELKQSEGDPLVRNRLRQIRQERARQRTMAAVAEATVLVTNPTHFAVAMTYRMEEMDAPIITAKGIDHLALRMRDHAKAHDVPVVENPPLARALYAGVELDQQIPPEHYLAAAEIIGYVMRLKNGTSPGARR